MMQGTVTKYQARLTVPFLLVGKPNLGIEFVVDTGFAGELTLPASAVAALGLPFLTELTANLADDSGEFTDSGSVVIKPRL